jgi:polyketide cyclase/dehydrase/lipid transport protein
MRKKVALATAVASLLAVAIAVAGARYSSHLRTGPTVRRAEASILVDAPPDVIAAQLTNPERWVDWSPWDARDARVKRAYGGATDGAGASCYWSGEGKVGKGRLTVIRATAEAVDLERELELPEASLSDLEFRLAREGNATRVSWVMKTEEEGVGAKVRALWPVGGRSDASDLERGLSRLKDLSEAQAHAARWSVARTARVPAPAAAVLRQLVDLKRWPAWSPWERAGMHRAFGGTPEGTGASYYWTSTEPEFGRGRVTILRATEDALALEVALDEPRAALADLEVRVTADGDESSVTFAMSGDVEVRGEVLGRRGEPEATIGVDLENGLARLAEAARAAPALHAAR